MIDPKILETARKLKALADRGEGGEKENAKRMLEKYMKKHNLTFKNKANLTVDQTQLAEFLREELRRRAFSNSTNKRKESNPTSQNYQSKTESKRTKKNKTPLIIIYIVFFLFYIIWILTKNY